jgi:DNA helicase HerA-like ATPase
MAAGGEMGRQKRDGSTKVQPPGAAAQEAPIPEVVAGIGPEAPAPDEAVAPVGAPEEELAPRPDVDRMLRVRGFAHDVSNAVLCALERRHIDTLDVTHVPAPTQVEDTAPGDVFFLKVARIGHGTAMERSLDLLNMQNVLGTFRGGSHSLIVGLGSDGREAQLYLGARKLNVGSGSSPGAFDFIHNLRRTVEGNLPGTRFHTFAPGERSNTCPPGEIYTHISQPLLHYPYMAALTGIPSLRGEREQQFAQSLDRLVQALQGQRYLMLIIAEPVEERRVNEVLTDCLRLGSEIHSWVRISSNFSQAISDSVAKARADGTVTNQAEAEATARSVAKGQSKQPGAILGGVLGASIALMGGPLLGPALAPAAVGIGGMASYLVTAVGGSVSDNISDTESTSRTKSWGESVTESLTLSSSRTDSSSVTVEHLNKTAEYCEKVIEGYILRLQRAKNLGMWNVGIYFLAEDAATFTQGQSQLRALYSGKETYFEPMRTVDLSQALVRGNIEVILSGFSNPVLELMDPQTGEPLKHPLGKLHRSLSTPLNTEELALLLNLPRREVPGLPLDMVADFGVNPRVVDREDSILLGNLVSGGSRLDIQARLELNDLKRHAFVTGITGSGKTNTCFALLKALAARQVPFLVIEPAKSEYRGLMDDPDIRELSVYTAGDETISPFRINPFQFVPGVNLITHLDHMKSIFNASFPMYAAMPYLLEEAIVEVYEEQGWDLVRSTNRHLDMEDVVRRWRKGERDYTYTSFLPTLGDLLLKIDHVVTRKGYAEEVTKNYAAALKARIHSLLLGSKGRMFNTVSGITYEELFCRSTVLELRSMGDDDEKCFLICLLLSQLYEYRDQLHRWDPQPGLRHLTVLEEAHRLLGHVPQAVSADSGNTRGKAVETFSNMLAEIREYGEGFLIVDQTPVKLIPDVVKNTSTKILHRITARDDRDFVGDAMGMTEEQKVMVPRLRVGNAIVHMEDLDKPMWIQIDAVKGKREPVTDGALRERMAAMHRHRVEVQMQRVQSEALLVADEVLRLAKMVSVG